MKIKELEKREKAEGEKSKVILQELQSMGRTCPVLQPSQVVLHLEGRRQASCQPDETNDGIYRVVRQARKTIGFSPISNSNIKELMDEMGIKNIKEGMEEVIKDFLMGEMAMPVEEIRKLQFSRIFRKEGNDKLYVEFEEDSMSANVYKYVKKMRSECNVLTYIPEAFRERAEQLEKAAYSLRHSLI